MIFDHKGAEVGRHQLEHEQILPQAGWVEHNPVEIWERTRAVLTSALTNTHLSAGDIAAMGITNQRETSVVWNRTTGRPYYKRDRVAGHPTDHIAAALIAMNVATSSGAKPVCRPPPTFRESPMDSRERRRGPARRRTW